jgi:hypothetical protein
MTIREIMKFIESEYEVINRTPCEVCGGDYFAEDLEVSVIDGEPFDICECICANCGHERAFMFFAPFIIENRKKLKHNLN